MELRGKVALVTGAARRVGRAIALGLAEAGCDLMVHYHQSRDEAAETCQLAEALGVRAESVQADLSWPKGVRTIFEAVDQAYGGLDLLVNSAATLDPLEIMKVGEADWQRVVGLNLQAAFFCTQHAALRMQPRGGGAIVNISDTAAHRPWPRYPLHSISKAGLEMLTRVAALALAPTIRVNSIVPGPVFKPGWMPEARWQELGKGIPMQAVGRAADIAAAVLFLFRNEYITGESLRVDGGTTQAQRGS